jgi:acid stress-induced BolA-like protein IbaG/YrbA
MHDHNYAGDVVSDARDRIIAALPDAEVEVSGGGGHFVIRVVSPSFEGKRAMPRQRAVYAAIQPLMAGDMAPIHAVDVLTCLTPAEAAGA